jgi:predicted RNA-binding protein Jag
LAENLLNEMINKINQITASLDGTIAQINQMSTAIQTMSQKFSEETISVNENIRLIVEVLKQFRMKSSENMQEIADNFNAKIKELYEKKSIESITEEEKKAIDVIKQAAKAVSNNLYYAQLLNIIQSIREETNRIISCKEP